MLFFSSSVLAEFDISFYQKEIIATGTEIPGEILYPEYFRRTDLVTLRNIVAEVRFRLEFMLGIRPEPRYRNCYKMQKRLAKALERMVAAEKSLPFNFVDDELVFHPDSPLAAYLKPMPLKISDRCSYKSFGDPEKNGVLYCAYHGVDMDSEFYQTHQHSFNSVRPWLTAFDIVELLIFMPAMLIIPVTWLIMKKVLDKNQPDKDSPEG